MESPRVVAAIRKPRAIEVLCGVRNICRNNIYARGTPETSFSLAVSLQDTPVVGRMPTHGSIWGDSGLNTLRFILGFGLRTSLIS